MPLFDSCYSSLVLECASASGATRRVTDLIGAGTDI
jgi:hypothetical protein